MAKIVHMTSVHSPLDPRIFSKECVALAAAGHDVVLIAAEGSDSVRDGVRIRTARRRRGRFRRIVVTAGMVFRAALAERADVYHFHDPELIPWGLLLRLLGKRVVYDVHEDYVSGMSEREYIPGPLRSVAAHAVNVTEQLAARAFHIVLAERYYKRRFPAGVTVLNYPTVAASGSERLAFSSGSRRLLYTGNVAVDRGALIHAQLLARSADIEPHCLGRCRGEVARAMEAAAGAGSRRLFIDGVDAYVPFSRIRAAYDSGGWLCGMAVFPSSPHYREKELTKFFEYMLAGLPVVCSDFPVWRALVEGEGVGVCVPPDDPDRIVSALDWLSAHPEDAERMSRTGQRLVLERFNWSSEARQLTTFYDRILSEG